MIASRLVALALALTATATEARADPSTDEAEAERLYQRGDERFRAGAVEEAIDAFEAGYRLAPRPEFLFNLAQCHRALGRRAEAIRYLDRFVKLAPDHPFRAQAMNTLAELRRAEEEERRASERQLVRPTPPPERAPPPPAAVRRSRLPLWIAAAALTVASSLTVVWLLRADDDGDGLGTVALPPP